jgi:hypothetical protein
LYEFQMLVASVAVKAEAETPLKARTAAVAAVQPFRRLRSKFLFMVTSQRPCFSSFSVCEPIPLALNEGVIG